MVTQVDLFVVLCAPYLDKVEPQRGSVGSFIYDRRYPA